MVSPQIPESVESPAWTRAEFVLLGALLAATFLLYSPTLRYEFVYDDRLLLLQNPQLLSWRFVPQFFRENFTSSALAGAASVYYRPVLLVWMLVNVKLWGMNPVPWHLMTILLHLLVVAEVYLLARGLLRDTSGAALAAAVAALHPAHVECVAWIMAQAEQLAVSLLLASFLVYLGARRRPQGRAAWMIVSLGFFTLAVLIKENEIMLPGLIAAYEWLFGAAPDEQAPLRRAWLRTRSSVLAAAPYFAVAAVYLVVRVRVLGTMGQKVTPLPLATHLATIPSVLASYLRILLWPTGLSVEYHTPYVERLTGPNFFLPAAVVACFVALLVAWGWRSRCAAFASVWLALPLLPALDLPIFFRDEIVHDRYLYLPAIGFALLVGLAFLQLSFTLESRGRLGLKAAAVVLAGLLGAGTWYYQRFWKDNFTLFSRALQISPSNLIALNNTGNELADRGQWTEALDLYRRALALDPTYWQAVSNAGYCLYRLGRFQEAEQYLTRAITLTPGDSSEFVYLGMTYFKMGRLREAE
ncbi:MAG TPA: tetratricopeptide repeat protein, partial [Terriglobia bacterium]|nr:tetratricopeptide repeat protein [Terriglobia bacterium]